MPLFRFIAPPPGLEDAAYLYDVNPDPSRYEPSPPEKPKRKADPTPEVPADAPAESESEAQ